MSTISGGVYFIQNVRTSTVLDLDGGSSTNGTPVQGYQQRSLSDSWVTAQLWVVSQAERGGVYTIQNAGGSTHMEVPNGNTHSGTRIVCQQPSGQRSQSWVIIRNNANTGYVIQNQASQTFVDLLNTGTANGTPVNGWNGAGAAETNPTQLWNFVRA